MLLILDGLISKRLEASRLNEISKQVVVVPYAVLFGFFISKLLSYYPL